MACGEFVVLMVLEAAIGVYFANSDVCAANGRRELMKRIADASVLQDETGRYYILGILASVIAWRWSVVDIQGAQTAA